MRNTIRFIFFLLLLLLVLGNKLEVYYYLEPLQVFYDWPINLLTPILQEDVILNSNLTIVYDEDTILLSLAGTLYLYGFIFLLLLILTRKKVKPLYKQKKKKPKLKTETIPPHSM